MSDFFTAVEKRRSIYAIGKSSPISDERIKEIVSFAVKHGPSAYNAQGGRVILLLAKHHERFWNLVEEALRKIVPPERFAPTEEKMASFRNGHGTVLFFEDDRPVRDLQERFPTYAAQFPVWAQHASAIAQFIVWTGLESEGLGASLQHYGPVVEQAARREWNIPEEWQFVAQIPFGAPLADPGEKEFLPLSDRVRIFE
ncbi:MAG TPA: nitroreductase [Synergistaceae bacterium]|jgi:hypothetical protein|nr:nitroreductase [Synergistaceae bacterium]